MRGTVFNIQHFCTQDGPGIRTTVFLKGCPMRCAWCHNPESWRAEPEILHYPDKCIGCGACASICPNGCHTEKGFDRTNCVSCGRCAQICPAEALVQSGKQMSAEDVLNEIRQDEAFYAHSGGGVTISGGEPLFQSGFALAIARSAHESGISVALETSGFAKTETLMRFVPYVDLFLYDCKHTDAEQHRRYTGVDNTLILANLKALDAARAAVILRCPVIPGVNDTEAHLRALASMPEKYPCIREIQLEPYHPLGIEKNRSLGREPAYANPDFLDADKVRSLLNDRHIESIVPMTVQ